MSDKRMFSKQIIDSDAFLEMPLSTQALYFHLSMRADDDGFVDCPKKIQRMVRANDDDFRLLLSKRYILIFESGVIVIKHWRIHNTIKKDRYKPTVYIEEKAQLALKANNAYTEKDKVEKDENPIVQTIGTTLEPERNQDGNTISIDKVNKDKYIDSTIVESSSDVNDGQGKYDWLIEAWNNLSVTGIKPIYKLAEGTKRLTNVRARVRQYGKEDVLRAINNINNSKFLQGNNKSGWTITFDWFVLPTNFAKVLEGNYEDKGTGTGSMAQKYADLDEKMDQATQDNISGMTEEEMNAFIRGEI